MKTIVILAVTVATLAAGCSSTNISELVKAASQDPAKVKLTVTGVWGQVEYTREMPAPVVAVSPVSK